MLDEGKVIDLEEVVRKRLNRLVNVRRGRNHEAIKTLSALDSAWDELNGGLEKDTQDVFQQMTLEERAMDEARALLEKNPFETIDPNAIIIAGKVVEETRRTGIPGLRIHVKIGSKVIAESTTDLYGNFTVSLGNLDVDGLVLDVLADEKLVILSRELALPRVGSIQRLILEVAGVPSLAERIEGGKANRDSIDSSGETVSARLANMREAQTALAELNALSREGLNTLREQLNTPPPIFPGSGPGPEPEPEDPIITPDGGGGTEDPVVEEPTGSFSISGKLTRAGVSNFSGLTVILFDKNKRLLEKDASAPVKENGVYRIQYHSDKLQGSGPKFFEAQVRVVDRRGVEQYRSRNTVTFKPGGNQIFNIKLKSTI